MLQLFHLEKYRHQPPHLLSGGEKQRLAIASVVAMQPRHIIFDEPTSLLDYPSRVELLNLITALHRGENTLAPEPLTIIFITQFPEEALFARRLLVFEQGRIKFDGPPVQIFQKINEMMAMGLRPPLEFLVWQRMQNQRVSSKPLPLPSIEDIILDPIL